MLPTRRDMTPQERSLRKLLRAVNVTGPDPEGCYWIEFRSTNGRGAVSVRADSVAGEIVARWRDEQRTALANG